METEIWKPIQWHEMYLVSSLWNIASKKSWDLKMLTPWFSWKPWNDYRRLTVWEQWKWKHMRINRLVAEYFVKKVPGKTIVNHKNWDRFDDRAVNLEWSTSSENNKHAWSTGLQKMTQKKLDQIKTLWYNRSMKEWNIHSIGTIIKQFTLSWEFVKSWNSTCDVYRELWFHPSWISRCCRWNQKKCQWFVWKYSTP